MRTPLEDGLRIGTEPRHRCIGRHHFVGDLTYKSVVAHLKQPSAHDYHLAIELLERSQAKIARTTVSSGSSPYWSSSALIAFQRPEGGLTVGSGIRSDSLLRSCLTQL